MRTKGSRHRKIEYKEVKPTKNEKKQKMENISHGGIRCGHWKQIEIAVRTEVTWGIITLPKKK